MFKRLFIFVLVAFLAGCATGPQRQAEGPNGEAVLTEAQSYFVEVVLRTEFDDVTPKTRDSRFKPSDSIDGGKEMVGLNRLYNITDRQRLERQRVVRRWQRPVYLYVEGDRDPQLLAEIDKIIAELRELAPELEVRWAADKKKSNFLIFFGPYKQFSAQYMPNVKTRLKRNWGFFSIRWFKGRKGIASAKMYVDTDRAKDEAARKHLLREELTQALGLVADSKLYPDSIFYQSWSTTTEYSELDKELIKMLYDQQTQHGMSEKDLRAIWNHPDYPQQEQDAEKLKLQALGLER